MELVFLLGASGYVGQAFAVELKARGVNFLAISRRELDYTRFDVLLEFMRVKKPTFVINVAGYVGQPNVDACEGAKSETLKGSALLAQTVAHACVAADVPWGYVSSGCIYSGAKVIEGGCERVEKDLAQPSLKALIAENPSIVFGFKETDQPNFSFHEPPCSFYSGSKALAESAIANLPRGYLWRLRIPFDEIDNPRNYLTKIQSYGRVYDNVNSLSHRGDFVCACLDLWSQEAPFGIYNVTNPGFVSTKQVVELIKRNIHPDKDFEFWENDEEFYRLGAKTPRSNCILDVTKLMSAGINIRPVEEALQDALGNWVT